VKDFEPATFGRHHAAVYDSLSVRDDTAETVTFLAERAGEGPVLELAIGTGRVALPLAQRGLRVDGIEISPEMVGQLRAKPGGADLEVTVADMAAFALPGRYPLVFLVFNSLFNLLSADDQAACFGRAAAHLTDDGRFVVEAFVPSALGPEDQYLRVEDIAADRLVLDIARHDRDAQRLDETHVVLTEGGVRLYPVVTRYAGPEELDEFAERAGLRLQERWAGWRGEPFGPTSGRHVSVYGR
jgi:SAM-dependent methyltransferase